MEDVTIGKTKNADELTERIVVFLCEEWRRSENVNKRSFFCVNLDMLRKVYSLKFWRNGKKWYERGSILRRFSGRSNEVIWPATKSGLKGVCVRITRLVAIPAVKSKKNKWKRKKKQCKTSKKA